MPALSQRPVRTGLQHRCLWGRDMLGRAGWGHRALWRAGWPGSAAGPQYGWVTFPFLTVQQETRVVQRHDKQRPPGHGQVAGSGGSEGTNDFRLGHVHEVHRAVPGKDQHLGRGGWQVEALLVSVPHRRQSVEAALAGVTELLDAQCGRRECSGSGVASPRSLLADGRRARAHPPPWSGPGFSPQVSPAFWCPGHPSSRVPRLGSEVAPPARALSSL